MSDKGVCRTAPATPGLLNIIQRARLLTSVVFFSGIIQERDVDGMNDVSIHQLQG